MSLVSQTHPTSDSGLTVALHPLILLTISDYITRHTLRRQPRPIVGAILGQQNGRSITLEHAFECETREDSPANEGSQNPQHGTPNILLHDTWFQDRLQQYKDVHKAPSLELMGWFTTTPGTGPEAAQIPIHQQILQTYNETAVLLAFHPTKVIGGEGQRVGGKLPLTIYESFYESAGDAGAMEVDSAEDAQANVRLEIKFRELPYSVETGEAEMIGVDFVARGGGNATAINGGATAASAASTQTTSPKSSKGKGKPPANRPTDSKSPKETKPQDDALSPEDEELIASLTARANAVRMLHSRISLLKSYLSSLPPSYLTLPASESAATPLQQHPTPNQDQTQSDLPNHPLLRSISALLSRLPLLLPLPTAHTAPQRSDTELTALLAALGSSVTDARELGRKFAIVEGVRGSAGKKAGGGGMAGGKVPAGWNPFGGGEGGEEG